MDRTTDLLLSVHVWGWSVWFCPVMEWCEQEGRYVVAD